MSALQKHRRLGRLSGHVGGNGSPNHFLPRFALPPCSIPFRSIKKHQLSLVFFSWTWRESNLIIVDSRFFLRFRYFLIFPLKSMFFIVLYSIPSFYIWCLKSVFDVFICHEICHESAALTSSINCCINLLMLPLIC